MLHMFNFSTKNNKELGSTLIEVVLLLILCIFPCLCLYLAGGDTGLQKIISSVLYTLPLCCFIASIRNKVVFVLLTTFITIGACIESVMVLLYDNYIAAGNMLAVLTTTSEEGGEFAKNSLHALPISIPVLVLLSLTIVARNRVKHAHSKLGLSLFFVTLFSACAFVAIQTYRAKQTILFYARQHVYARPPYNLGFQIANAYHQTQIRGLIKESDKINFGAKRKPVDGKETYVLAIGESSRYGNWSLMGYERETTPLLESTNGIIAFTDYYSTATLTMFSVPQILTRATASDFEVNYKEKSIFKPFQECGFKTFAIVCKNLLSYETYLTSGMDSLFCVGNDAEVPALIDSLAKVHEKTFFIVQFLGSHSFYSNYDREREVYAPNYNTNPEDKSLETLINSYDNTILYTDYVLSSIIQTINQPDRTSGMIFVSDHGEDFRPGTGGHGGTSQPGIDEYHVPFIIWNSESWINENQKKKKFAEKHRTVPVNGDNIFYSACDMVNIELDKRYAKPEWSIFSPRFQEHKRKLLLPDGTSSLEIQ